MVMEMIRAAEVREDDEAFQSPLDELFDRLELRNPEHIALKYYRNYHSGSAKTLKSIQITLVSRLEKFNLDSLASMTQTDELELWSLGERKTAIFALIPDNDSSFNFIVGMLYTQLFQQLYYQADVVHGGLFMWVLSFVMILSVYGRFFKMYMYSCTHDGRGSIKGDVIVPVLHIQPVKQLHQGIDHDGADHAGADDLAHEDGPKGFELPIQQTA